jgi:hypothetical protein
MTTYTDVHADVLEQVRENGSDITFTDITQVHTPSTGSVSPVETTVTGVALQVKGNPNTYNALTLIESAAPTLLFVPDEYGALPEVGATCEWGVDRDNEPITYSVRNVDPFAPDGVAIYAKIVIVR